MGENVLHEGLFTEVGWLAPDGKYYVPSDRTSHWLHYDIGIAILEKFHPDVALPDMFHISDVMWSLGYIRVDLERTMLLDDTHKPTDKQFDTLFNLYQMKGWIGGKATEGIRQFLVEQSNGQFEFLRKDTDYDPSVKLVPPRFRFSDDEDEDNGYIDALTDN